MAANQCSRVLLAGLLADTLSYTGATLAELQQNRRYNPLAPDERDKFGQLYSHDPNAVYPVD